MANTNPVPARNTGAVAPGQDGGVLVRETARGWEVWLGAHRHSTEESRDEGERVAAWLAAHHGTTYAEEPRP